VSRSVFEFALSGVAVGDFAGDGRADVAVLSTEGAVQVLTRIGSEKSTEAKTQGAKEETAREAKQPGDEAEAAVEWERSERTGVSVGISAPEGAQTVTLLMTAKVSNLAKDDLLVLGDGRAHVITNEAAKVKAESFEVENVEAAADFQVSATVSTESELAAALPMRLNSSALSSLVVVGAASKSVSVATPAAAVTFTVNSAADTSDANRGNGLCADANGNCTLRAAIEELNSNTDPGPYTINFNIPGAGVPTIFTSQQLISKPVLIDGTTQAAGRVEIIDRAASNGFLYIRGGNSTIRGLVISSSETLSILLQSNNNIIEGCYFGTNSDGTAVAASRSNEGISVSGSNNRVGGTTPAARNIISGLVQYGIHISGGTGNVVQGNRIGTNASGTAALGNGVGIRILGPGTIIGGTEPGAGNLLSGNGSRENYALSILSTFATVQGNLFGTNATGDALIGNTGDALFVSSRNGVTTIGGTTPAARNIIAGSTGRGIYIDSAFNDNPAFVQGNYIGTNADGTGALPNLSHGIFVSDDGIIVGGTAPGAGNLTSGNGEDGIHVNGQLNTVQGNLVGTDVSGTLAIPNQGDGVELQSAFDRGRGNLIGGTTPEARNVISGNRENGINFGGGGTNNPNRAKAITSAEPLRHGRARQRAARRVFQWL
jgi:CSLREA domain-containing protein